VIENTAGQGSCVGHRFEHLGEFLEKVGYPERIGICLDTQHSYAAGYDLKSAEGLAEVVAAFEAKVGLKHLVAFHLNDSKVGYGGRVDRHECLGKGTLGFELFARLMNDRRFDAIPGFLETPAGPEGWRREIAKLRSAVTPPPEVARAPKKAVARSAINVGPMPRAQRAAGGPARRGGSRRRPAG
jgi:deoxyribonuclease-4